jgi:hypothetical protein
MIPAEAEAGRRAMARCDWFGGDNALAPYNVPILINPYGYSVYRGG